MKNFVKYQTVCNSEPGVTQIIYSFIEIIFIVRLGSADSVTVKVRWLLKVLFVWCYCCCCLCVYEGGGGGLLNGVFF